MALRVTTKRRSFPERFEDIDGVSKVKLVTDRDTGESKGIAYERDPKLIIEGRKFNHPRKIKSPRYRLHRSQILQENMRWKALAEMYTMHSFTLFWNPYTVLESNPKKRGKPWGGKDPGPIPGKMARRSS